MLESRVAPLTGVLFGVLLFGSFVVNPNTDFMPPAGEVVAFYQAGPRRALVSAYLVLLSAAALVWFTASTHRWLRGQDDDGGRLAVLATGGGVLAAVMLVVSGLVTMAAADRLRINGSIDSGAAATLFDISSVAVGTGAPVGLAILIGSTGLVALRSTAVSPWIGRTCLLISLGLLSPFAWALSALTLLWVPAAGVWIYMAEQRQQLVPSP